jgi:hypothetical protein
MFLKRVGGAYHAFIDATERAVRGKCQEDLQSTTRYITWSLHTRSGGGLRIMLGDVRGLAAALVPFLSTASPHARALGRCTRRSGLQAIPGVCCQGLACTQRAVPLQSFIRCGARTSLPEQRAQAAAHARAT